MASMTTANRTSGLAPLAVFFDAVDTVPGTMWTRTWTSGVVQPADRLGTLYEWDFGDGTSGTWTQTGLSRNTATGFTAAHVYETPGTYTATLTVTQTDGTVTTYTQTITVAAFSGTTYYVAANGSDSNPGTEAQPFLTPAKGFSMAAANRQILFRRGDSFTAAPLSISASGPGIVGAYGTGAKPIITSSASNNSNTPQNAITANGDWRVMDLEVRGTAWACLQSGGTYPLFLRCFVNGGAGVFCGLGGGGTGAAFVENEVASSSTYGTYFEGYQFAVLGNNVHDIGTSHAVRIPHMAKGVISHNRMWNPGATRQALKLHSDNASNDTRWVTVTDNLWRSDLWTVSIGAQDSGVYETPNYILVERNKGYAASGCTASLILHSSHMLARNNVFDMTGCGNGCTAIWAVHMGTVVPVEDDIRIYNNTVYRGGAADDFAGVAVSSWPTNSTASGPTNVNVRNNLVAAATGSGKYVVALDGITTSVLQAGRPAGAGLVNTNNVLNASPGFTNAAGGDFSLTSGATVAINTGATLPEVKRDFLGLVRPAGAAYDIGAYEYGATAPVTGIPVTYPSDTTWEATATVQAGANQFEVTDGVDTITVDLATLAGAADGRANVSGQLRVTVPLTGRADGHGGASAALPNVPSALQGGADGQAGASGTLGQAQPLRGTASGQAGAGLYYSGTASPVQITLGSRLTIESEDASTVDIIVPVMRAASADESSVTVYVFPSDYYGPTTDDVALYGRADGRAGASGTITQALGISGRADGRGGASGALTQALPMAARADGQAGATGRLTIQGNYVPKPPYWEVVTRTPVVAMSRGKGFAYAFPVILGGTEAVRRVQRARGLSPTRQRVAKLVHPSPPSLQ